jgi:hypothetical protein
MALPMEYEKEARMPENAFNMSFGFVIFRAV